MLLLYRIHAFLSSNPRFDWKIRIWRFAQIPNVWYIPNIPDNPSARFFAVVPIFQRQKVDHQRLYCASEKLTAAEELLYIYNVYCPPRSWKRSGFHYIYNMYSVVQSLSSSVQKHMNALPNRNATSQITGSSVGATRRTQPPANALTKHPNAHRIFTITDYLPPLQTPSWRVPAPYRRLLRRLTYTGNGLRQQ